VGRRSSTRPYPRPTPAATGASTCSTRPSRLDDALADSISADILGEVETRALQWEAGPAAYRRASGKVNTLFGSFKTELLSPALASFTLTWTDDSSNGEPALGVQTLTYDLATGQRIQFNPLFVDSKAALTAISAEFLADYPS